MVDQLFCGNHICKTMFLRQEKDPYPWRAFPQGPLFRIGFSRYFFFPESC